MLFACMLLRETFQLLQLPPTAIHLGDARIGYAKATLRVGVSSCIELVTCILWLSIEDSL